MRTPDHTGRTGSFLAARAVPAALILLPAALVLVLLASAAGCTSGTSAKKLEDPSAQELLDIAATELNSHITQIEVDRGRLVYDGANDIVAEYRVTPSDQELLFRAREGDAYVWLASPSPPEWYTAATDDLLSAAEQQASPPNASDDTNSSATGAESTLIDVAQTVQELLELDLANPFDWMLLVEPDGPVETSDSEGTPFAVSGNVPLEKLAPPELVGILDEAAQQSETAFLPEDWRETGIRLRIWFNGIGTPVRFEAGTYGPGDVPADTALQTILLDRIDEPPELPDNPTPYP